MGWNAKWQALSIFLKEMAEAQGVDLDCEVEKPGEDDVEAGYPGKDGKLKEEIQEVEVRKNREILRTGREAAERQHMNWIKRLMGRR